MNIGAPGSPERRAAIAAMPPLANACGHWAGSIPVRHATCADLPLTQCVVHARPLGRAAYHPDLPKDVIE